MSVRPENATKVNVTFCKFPPKTVEYTFRDAILYALGIGFSTEDEFGLRYLYENSEDFQVFPSYGVMLAIGDVLDMMRLPGLKINLANVLHLEQYLEQHRPFPAHSKVMKHFEIVDVLDRKVGSQYIYRIVANDDKGPLFTSEGTLFISGDGKFGGRIRTDKPIATIMCKPMRAPDAILEYKIGLEQSAIFRLSGDYNPIHIEPAFAKKANLDRNILHGNCTMGIAAQLILKKYANADAGRFKKMMARFSNVTYPGDTLQVYTWQNNNIIQFEAKTKERGESVLTGAYVELHEEGFE